MYMCILDQAGAIVLHRNMKADPQSFLQAIEPYRQDIVIAAECIFTWYWLADLPNASSIPACSPTWRSI